MFGLLKRSSGVRKPVSRPSVRLCLERLEDRYCPSGPSPDLGGGGGGGNPPETLTLNVTYEANRHVLLTGHLSNSSGPVTQQTIAFGGVLPNYYAATNNNGDYSCTLTATQLGVVTATSTDGLSNTAQYTLVGGSPVISNFQAVSEGNGIWLLSGTVTGAPSQGEVVTLGGINALKGVTATVNASGSFSVYVTVATGQGGWATAYATDWWGDESQQVMTLVNC